MLIDPVGDKYISEYGPDLQTIKARNYMIGSATFHARFCVCVFIKEIKFTTLCDKIVYTEKA